MLSRTLATLSYLASCFLLHSAGSAGGEAASTRAAFLQVIERPRVPLAAEEKELAQTNGLTSFHFTFAAESEQRVTGILIKQSNVTGRRPVVVALHGTGGTKESQLPLLTKFANLGFLGVAVDGRFHGERARAGKGAIEYTEAILRAYHTGKEHPFLYDTVWDVMRLIDYLVTRPDVDPKRIGVIGFSKGGMEAYLAAAADPRVAVAVPCIGVQSFRWALENNAWQSRIGTIQATVEGAARESGVTNIDANFVRKFYERVVPGICSQFDGPIMVPLIAPRPLLVINGDSDDRTPLIGLSECVDATRKAYRAAQAGTNFSFRLQENTGHKVTPESLQAAVDWFVKWLKP